MSSNSSDLRCYEFVPDSDVPWGDCCEDLGIVPKPLWVILLFTLPIEAALAGADIRATPGMYAKKEGRAVLVFIFYNLVTLALLFYQFPFDECENDAKGFFRCYQGVVFMFYNSTAALAALTVWMLIVLRKFFWYMYIVTRTIIWPSFLWTAFEKSYGSKEGFEDAKKSWRTIGNETGLYWYNYLLMSIAFIFGAGTHIIPMFFAYPWVQGVLAIGLIYAHCSRMGYLYRMKQYPETILRPNLRSVAVNTFIIWPICMIIALISIAAVPLELAIMTVAFLFFVLYWVVGFSIAAIFCFCGNPRTGFETSYGVEADKRPQYPPEQNMIPPMERPADLQNAIFPPETAGEDNEEKEGGDLEQFSTAAAVIPPRSLTIRKDDQQNIPQSKSETGGFVPEPAAFKRLAVQPPETRKEMDDLGPPPAPLDQTQTAEEQEILPELHEILELPAKDVTEDIEQQFEQVKKPAATRIERVQKTRKQLLKYIMDMLKNLCLYDPEGRLIMFAASSVFFIFTFSANYGVLLYSGAPYYEIPLIDWNARGTALWLQCSVNNFNLNVNAFGIIDFVGLAVGVSAGIIELADFVSSLCG